MKIHCSTRILSGNDALWSKTERDKRSKHTTLLHQQVQKIAKSVTKFVGVVSLRVFVHKVTSTICHAFLVQDDNWECFFSKETVVKMRLRLWNAPTQCSSTGRTRETPKGSNENKPTNLKCDPLSALKPKPIASSGRTDFQWQHLPCKWPKFGQILATHEH